MVVECTPHRGPGSAFSLALALHREAQAGEGTHLELPNYRMSQLNWVTQETELFLTAANAVPTAPTQRSRPRKDAFSRSEGGQNCLSLCLKQGKRGPLRPPHPVLLPPLSPVSTQDNGFGLK